MSDLGQYTCEECGQTFEKTVSDEEARAECAANFGTAMDDDLAIICDDCYLLLQQRAREASGIVAIAGEPDRDGTVLDAAALQALADGKFLFWEEERQALIYRGPMLGAAL